jgi:kumamolisin
MPFMPAHIEIAGSHRTAPTGARKVGRPDLGQVIEVTLRLRRGCQEGLWNERVATTNISHFSKRSYFDRRELAEHISTPHNDIAEVMSFAVTHNLRVVRPSTDPREVRLCGTITDLEVAFGITLTMFELDDGRRFRGREAAVMIPAALSGIVTGVFGFDERPFRRHPMLGAWARQVKSPKTARAVGSVAARPAALIPEEGVAVDDIMHAYNFPTDLDGSGQCIALIELNSVDKFGAANGGYLQSDIASLSAQLARPAPDVVDVFVAGGANNPGKDVATDHEVTMDVEVAFAVAPKAKIAVYFAPNTDPGFIAALAAAVHDNVRKPNIISVSWGVTEEHCTGQLLTGLSEILEEATTLGITVCCSTGDFGSSDFPVGSGDGRAHVEFPASSPYALACGGTEAVLSGSRIERETVWNDGRRAGGGGVSTQFPQPSYQLGLDVPAAPDGSNGRGVPDVAANAVGYNIVFQGENVIGNGTSITAPLWAGLVALINQSTVVATGNPVGFLHPHLYAPQTRACFRGVSEGSNDLAGNLGKYAANSSWNACVGWGSPDAKSLLHSLLAPLEPAPS